MKSTFENNLHKSEEPRHAFEGFDKIKFRKITDYSKFNLEEYVNFPLSIVRFILVIGTNQGEMITKNLMAKKH